MKIYLDTNIFDVLTKNDNRKRETETLFFMIENGKFEAYYSPTVVEELLLTPDKQQKFKLKKILDEKIFEKKCIRLIPISTQNKLSKIHDLVHAYWYSSEKEINVCGNKKIIREKSIFSRLGSQAEDRIHIATATINKIGAFVTWNIREYIERENIKNWINQVNIKLGYSEIEFYTPSQLIKAKN